MPVDIPFTDLAEINPGRGLKRGERYPFIEMASVLEGGGRPTHHDEREFDGGGSRFAVGDTLFARITPCTENGKIAFVDALPDGSVGFGSTELIVLSARPGKADPRFVYQVAASGRVRRQAIARMLGTSGRQRVPTWFFTEELTVPDFSLAEQRAIAAVLDAIDDTIERTEAVIAATEELRRALLHELLTRGVPGWHSEWRNVPGIGTVPACWDVVRLGDVATLQRGVDLPIQDRVQGSVPVYGSNGILGTHAQALHPGPGVITGRSGSIGVVYSSTGPYWPLNTTLYVRDFHGNSDRFIYYLLSQLKLERFAASTGVPSLNRNFVHPQPVARPPLAEQRLIVAVPDGVDEAIERARDEKAGLQSLKASASGALLTGSVRVRQFNG